MSRVASVAKALVPTVAFALLAGWSVYRDSPQGMARATGGDACAPLMHSFTSVYLVILGVAAGLAVAVAATIHIASLLGIFDRSQRGLKDFSITCALLAAGLVVAMVLKFPLEMVFPSAARAGCENVLPRG